MWSFTKARELNTQLFSKVVADHILSLVSLDGFNRKSCTQVLSAFPDAGFSHEALFEKVAEHAYNAL